MAADGRNHYCRESKMPFRRKIMPFITHWTFIVLLFSASLCSADDDHEMEEFLKREHSLSKPYQGVGSLGSSHWELMGDAMVTTEQVRLTPDMQSRQGAVWSRIPCHLQDWEMQVHFKIHGQGKKNLNGDGLAIWYTKERMQKGPVFGNMDNFTGLGVFVDTYPNEEKHLERIFPFVLAMVGNGSISYDHERDGRPTELGGCNAMVRNLKHDTFLFIRYIRRRLTVMIDIDGQHEWRDCLDIPGVRLPQGYYFGATAITGDLSDNHDIISLKLYQLTVLRSQKEEEEEEEEITIPSVDNIELLICKTHTHTRARTCAVFFPCFTTFTVIPSSNYLLPILKLPNCRPLFQRETNPKKG
uniref:Lectin, mannose-binding 2-like a n=1 Tax=Sparus aurata TaxID=8175 RepID=A0A671YRK0_SPAAU